MNPDSQTRSALEEHWKASERGDSEVEHAVYGVGAILDYPQSQCLAGTSSKPDLGREEPGLPSELAGRL